VYSDPGLHCAGDGRGFDVSQGECGFHRLGFCICLLFSFRVGAWVVLSWYVRIIGLVLGLVVVVVWRFENSSAGSAVG
jgi:hypothetical protein